MNRAPSRAPRFLAGLILLAVVLFTGAVAQAQTIFTEAFDGAWTNPPSLLTGGLAWSGIGTGNNEWHRNDFLTGWTSNTSGAYSPTGALSTANSARWHTYDASSGTTGAIITPSIDFTSYGGNKRVTFYSINTSGTDVMRVYLSTDGGTSYGSALATVGVNATWTQVSVPLGTTTSSTVKIKFETTGDFGTTDFGFDQMVVETYTPLTGTKVVGAGGDYTTFTAAINALNSSGVGAGGVTFNVTAGSTFIEDVPAIVATTGSSASAPIVFQKSGAGANPVIKPTGTAGTADFGFSLNGADYVTVDGIDITENTGSAVEFGFLIKNASASDGATNNTIKNTTVTLNRANTSSYGILQTSSSSLGGGTTPSSLAGSNASNKYQNFTVTNSYNGIALYGGSGSFPDASNEIGVTGGGSTFVGGASANDLGNGGSSCYGVRLITQSGVKVSGITVRNATITSSVTLYGIYLDNSSSGTYASAEISNNTLTGFVSTSTSSSSIIYGIRADASTGNTIRVFNNDVYGITPPAVTAATTTQVLRAISINGSGAGTVNVSFNSVNIGSGLSGTNLNGTSAAFYQGGGTSTLQNNIFSNVTPAQTTSKHYAAYVSSGTVSSSSNNVLWAPNTNGVVGSTAATDRTTLQIFAAATSATAPVDGSEGGSANADPGFTSATNLTFAGSTPAALSGIAVSGITTDITGAARSGTRPTIGAHETANAQNDQAAPSLSGVAIISSSTPSVSVTLTDNSAAASNATVQLWYRLGTSGAFTGVDADVKPAGAMNGTYTWSTSLSGLAAGSYQFYIGARDGGGAGTRLWANPIWTTAFPTSAGFAAADPPNYSTNPATYANVRSFTKTLSLAGGTYDVGSDQATLKKLTDVAAQLSAATLLGNVTYELNSTYDGTTGETFPVTFNQLSTSGGNWTVTIRVKAGAGARTTSGSSTTSIIKLNGGDRFTLDGREGGTGSARAWTVTNTSSATGTAVVWLSSLGTAAGATNNTVQYLTLATGIDASASSSEAFGILSSGTSISTSNDGADNDNNTFANNAITKARWGIYLRGASANTNDNNVISANVVGPTAFGTDEITKGGVIVQYQQAASITQNEVRFVGVKFAQTASGSDRIGIGLGDSNFSPTTTTMQNCTVSRNLVHDIVEEKTFSAVGILVAGTTAPTNNVISNNIIYNVLANATSGDQGIGLAVAAGDNDKVVYNTISLSGDIDPVGTTSASYPLVGVRISTASVTNLTLKDNILSADVTSNTATLHHYDIIAPSSAYAWGTGSANNNDFYVNAANPQMALGGLGTATTFTDVTTLSAWRTTFTPRQDSLSLAAQPPFLSATDLHLNAATPTALESAGTPIAGVTNDYDNDTRNLTTPDIGADEGDFTSLTANNMAATAFVSPTNGGSVPATVAFTPQASFTNAGTTNLTNIPVRYRILDNTSTVVYDQTAVIASLTNGSASTVSFPAATVATAGTYTIVAKAELVGDGVAADDSIIGSITAFTPLSGTYTVGVGGNYTTLTAAAADLALRGASGAVVFSLTDASYSSGSGETFPITINPWGGASATNALTIKPASSATVAISGSSTSSVLKLNGADYVTLDGSNSGSSSRNMTITNTSTATGTAAVWLASLGTAAGATNNTIKNVNLATSLDQTTSSSDCFGIISCGTTIGIGSDGADNDANTFQNNSVTQARWGIYLRGSVSNSNDNCVISQNVVGPTAFGTTQIGKAGIVLQAQNAAAVTQNEVRFVGSLTAATSSSTTRAGIGLGAVGTTPWIPSATTTVTNSTVARNVIHDIVDEHTYSAVGISVSESGTATANIIANNMLYGIRSDGTSGDQTVGIGISGGDGDKVVYNSIALSGDIDPGTSSTSSQSACGVRIASASVTNLTLEDNIISVDVTSNTATLHHYAIVAPAASYAWGTGVANNNDFSVNTSNTQMALGAVGTSVPYTDVATLALWKTEFTPHQDSLSLNATPAFVSASDLHLNTAVPTALESAGTPVASVTNDYDNDARNATTPDIGADEGSFLNLTANDMAASAFVVPTNGGSVAAGVAFIPQATFTNTGTIPQSSVTVRYRILDATSTEVYNQTQVIASIAGGAATTVSFPSATVAAAGSYTIVAKAELAGDGVPSNDQITGTITAFTPLSGTYTVGVGGAYTTLTAAVSSINTVGASGAVTFSLIDAAYPSETLPVTLTTWPGASATNTLTIKPASGVTASISGSSTSAILKLSGADYVTVDGSNNGSTSRDLTLENTNTSATSAVVWLSSPTASDGATHNTIKNTIVRGNASTTTLAAIYSGGTSVSSSAPVRNPDSENAQRGAPSIPGISAALTNNSDNTLQNNRVTQAQYGILVLGTSTTTLDTNTQITDNSVGSASEALGNFGVVVKFQQGATISRNDVQNVVSSTTFTNLNGIGVYDSKSASITRNLVHGMNYTGTSTTKLYAMYQTTATFTTSGNPSANLYANNMVYDLLSTGTSGFWSMSGINTEGGYGDQYFYNSVSLTGSPLSNSSSAMVAAFSNGSSIVTTTATALDIKNNVFSVTGGATTATPMYAHYTDASSYSTNSLNNDDVYAAATGSAVSYVGRLASVNYSTLAAWRTATGGEANSWSVAAPFISATNLHLNTGLPTALESGATPVAVTTDYDNDARNATTPDIGADEGAFTSLTANDMAATAFVVPLNGGTVSAGVAFAPQASFTNPGTVTQTSVTVRYRILDNASTEVYNQTATIATIAAGASTTVTFPMATVASSGAYSIIAQSELVGDAVPGNDQINGAITATTPLAGVYNVGVGGDYTTLTAAVAALNSVGVSGAVTFRLTDALYDGGETFPISINAWAGASSSNTLTIKPATGVTATITGLSTSSILKLNGADYVTLDGSNSGTSSRDLTIENTSTSTLSAVVWLSSPTASDGATHNTIKNAIVTGNAATTTLMGIYSGGTSISTTTPVRPQGPESAQRGRPQFDGITAALTNNSDNTYQNNAVVKAQYGIFLLGTSTTTLDTNAQVLGNSVGSPTAGLALAGIELKYQSGATVSQNDVQNVTQSGSSGSDFYGIEIVDTRLSTIGRNKVHGLVYNGTSTGKIWAIDQKTADFTTSGSPSANTYANNMVYDLTSSSVSGFWAIAGMNCDAGYGDKYFYNSVSLTGPLSGASSAPAAAFALGTDWNATSPTNTDVRDNIFSNTGSSAVATPAYAILTESSSLTGSTLDFNDEYAVATGAAVSFLGRLGTVDYTSLGSWQAATAQEAASQSVLAPFTAATDLHLVAASGTTLESAATPVPVTVDFDGQTRNATTPDVGADEGNFGANRPPVIATIPDQTVNENVLLTVTPIAGDPDGDVLTFSGSNLPTGATVNSASGVLSWTPDFTQSGVYLNVTITATDPSLATASRAFKITVNNVNRTPVMTAVSAKTMNEGQTLVVDLSATDADNENLVFSLVSITPAPPSGVLPTVTDSLPTHATFKWVPSYFDGSVTPYVMTVKVTDPSNAQAGTQFNVTLVNVNGPPVITDRADTTVIEATTSTVVLHAVEPDGQTIRWTLATPAPPWASLTNTSGPTAGVVFKPGYNSADSLGSAGVGADSIKVIAADGVSVGANKDTTVFILHITDVNRTPVLAAISNQTIAENALLSFTASASDADVVNGDVLTWSMTGAPSGAALNASNGAFTWTPDFSASERVPGGVYGGISVTVTDAHSASDSKSFQITVTNTNRSPVVNAIANQTVAEGSLLTFTATGSDPDSTDAIASWSLSGPATGATIGATTGVFNWTPGPLGAQTNGGVYNETVTATDTHGGTGSTGFSITVTDVNRPPVVTAIGDQTVAEGSLLTVSPSGSDPDGNTLTWSGSSLPAGASVAPSTGVLSWTPSFTQAGVYPGVTLTANDGNGGTASAAFQITVTNTNRAPVVLAIANQTVAEGALLTVTPSGSDADGDALSWTGSNLPSGSSVAPSTGVFTWTPSFAQAGSYPAVTLTASDGSLTGSASFSITVTNSNRAPVVASIRDTTVVGDDVTLLSITPSATDADGDAVTWSGTGVPAGASVNSATGVFTWTPLHTQGGSYTITLTANDGNGGIGSSTFHVTVTVPTGVELTASKLGLPTTFGIPVMGQSPFHRSVEFVVGTPTPSTIAVRVLDAKGRLVATLSPKAATPGYAMFRWDGRGEAGRSLASGVYYLRASNGHAVATRRVVKMD